MKIYSFNIFYFIIITLLDLKKISQNYYSSIIIIQYLKNSIFLIGHIRVLQSRGERERERSTFNIYVYILYKMLNAHWLFEPQKSLENIVQNKCLQLYIYIFLNFVFEYIKYVLIIFSPLSNRHATIRQSRKKLYRKRKKIWDDCSGSKRHPNFFNIIHTFCVVTEAAWPPNYVLKGWV